LEKATTTSRLTRNAQQLKNRIEPAINVFEKNKHLLKEINFHPDAEKYYKEYIKSHPNYLGSIQPVIPVSSLTFLFQYFGFILPFSLYACWTILALYDLQHSQQNKILWRGILILLPFLGSLIYLWGFRQNLPKWLTLTTTITGIAIYFVLLIFSITIIF